MKQISQDIRTGKLEITTTLNYITSKEKTRHLSFQVFLVLSAVTKIIVCAAYFKTHVLSVLRISETILVQIYPLSRNEY